MSQMEGGREAQQNIQLRLLLVSRWEKAPFPLFPSFILNNGGRGGIHSANESWFRPAAAGLQKRTRMMFLPSPRLGALFEVLIRIQLRS